MIKADFSTTAREVFLRAIAAPAQARLRVVEAACRGDEELRAFVTSLLRAHDGACGTEFLGRTGGALLPTFGEVPCRLGPYRLLRLIGEGGFGTVFLARQDQPVRREVALKIIKPGMDSRQVVARFEAERQALARMDHPGIARVFDAGATDSGRPYFVMELVPGVPINEYCDGRSLPIHERLRVFVQVCRAVQHAHQKGVIHRDLKPSNILVATGDEGQPLPKVIDFGIAKAVAGGPLTDHAMPTEYPQPVGTPQYMAPEQITFGRLDSDTRSDIYSLGVLLYELLVGTTPFDPADLRGRPYDEVLRLLRETDPPPPSARVAASPAGLAGVAARRGVDPPRLRRLVRRELDWIVMKCLERDRSRRYETANGLASDVNRYLDGWPVAARRAGRLYRIGKFARRHKAAAAVAATVVLLLLSGVVGTGRGLVRARRAQQLAEGERERARLATAEAVEQRNAALRARADAEAQARHTAAIGEYFGNLLASARPAADGGGRAARVVDVLDPAAVDVGRHLAGNPQAQVFAWGVFGRTYQGLGLYPEAEENFSRAYELSLRAEGFQSKRTLRAAAELTAVRASIMETRPPPPPTDARAADAACLGKRAAEAASRMLGPDDLLAIDAVAAHGRLLLARGEHAAAQEVFTGLLKRMAHGADIRAGLNPLRVEGREGRRGRRTWSEQLDFRLDSLLGAAGADGPDKSVGSVTAPEKAPRDDASDEADRADRAALYARELARAFVERGEANRAEACLGDTLTLAVKGDLVKPAIRAGVALDLGTVKAELNKTDEALRCMRDALDDLEHHLGKAHPETQAAVDAYAGLLERKGLVREALGQRQAQLEGAAERKAADHELLADRICRTALLYHRAGLHSEGDRLFPQGIAMLRRLHGADASSARDAWRRWTLIRGLGDGGWASESLRSEAWLALADRLGRHWPAAAAGDGVRWESFRFRLYKWTLSASNTGLPAAPVAEGDLSAMKALPDPSAGAYLLAVEVASGAGTLREAEWLLFAPWRVSLHEFAGDRARAQWDWQAALTRPGGKRDLPCLSLDSATLRAPPGPAGRWRSFGCTAEAGLHLPPGPYRLTFTADDGVRAWAAETTSWRGDDRDARRSPAGVDAGCLDGRRILDFWESAGRVTHTADIAPSGHPVLLRLEYFQWKGDYTLRVRCTPDVPEADEWVAAALGQSPQDLAHWLVRDGGLLESAGRDADARARFQRAAALADQAGGAGTGVDRMTLLAAIGRTSLRLGDVGRAITSFDELQRSLERALGPDHEKTLEAKTHRVRALAMAEAAGAKASRRALSREKSAKMDHEIEGLSATLASYPEHLPPLRRRLELYGQRGSWAEAAADIDAVLKTSPREEDLWYRGAVVRLHLGQSDSYRGHCDEILRRFGRSQQSGAMRRVVKTCCLVPPPHGGAEAMLKIANEMYVSDPSNFWSAQVLALAYYRAGQHARAAQLLTAVPGGTDSGVATNDALLAMALYRCGDTSAAHDRLARARQALREAMPDDAPVALSDGWHDWLVCGILAAEAEKLLSPPQSAR